MQAFKAELARGLAKDTNMNHLILHYGKVLY